MLSEILIKKYIPSNGNGSTWPQVLAIIFSTFGSISSSALYYWTSPSIPILISDASHIGMITFEDASYFIVIGASSAIIASPFIALIVDIIGRKQTILMMTAFNISSWLLKTFSKTLLVLYLSCIAQGFSHIIMLAVTPMYIGEIAQPKIRVILGNSFPFFILLGQFVINLVGSFYDIPTTAVLMLSLSIFQLILILLIPESPYFFIKKNNIECARRSLKILRWKENVDEELYNIVKHIEHNEKLGTYKELFFSFVNRKALGIAMGLRACQQLSGMQIFFLYGQLIFNHTGSDISGSTSTIICGGIFSLAGVVFSFIVSKFGRRPLLILSYLGCGFALGLVGIYFYIYQKTTIDVSSVSWLPLFGMISFVIFCMLGIGLLPSVMIGELFAIEIKSKAVVIVNNIYYICTLSLGKLFQVFVSEVGMFLPFFIFSLCCFLSALFCYCFVPETRGKTLEQIQIDLSVIKESNNP